MEISVSNLGMEYQDGDRRVRVFSGLSLTVRPSESVAIIGRSGVGKTTLLSIFGGLEQPTEGEVRIGKETLSAIFERGEMDSFRGARVSFIFQFHHLLPEFDAVENAAFPLLIRGIDQETARAEAIKLLERVGLGHRLTHRPGTLSGGEQQRVAIARAVIGNPDLILADEPTGNLDRESGEIVSQLLFDLQKERGSSLILVTHSRELAGRCNRIVELTGQGLEELSK